MRKGYHCFFFLVLQTKNFRKVIPKCVIKGIENKKRELKSDKENWTRGQKDKVATNTVRRGPQGTFAYPA